MQWKQFIHFLRYWKRREIDCSVTLLVSVCIHSTCVQFSVSLMTTFAPKGTCNMQIFVLFLSVLVTILSVYHVSMMTNWHVDFYIGLAKAYRNVINRLRYVFILNLSIYNSVVFNDLDLFWMPLNAIKILLKQYLWFSENDWYFNDQIQGNIYFYLGQSIAYLLFI